MFYLFCFRLIHLICILSLLFYHRVLVSFQYRLNLFRGVIGMTRHFCQVIFVFYSNSFIISFRCLFYRFIYLSCIFFITWFFLALCFNFDFIDVRIFSPYFVFSWCLSLVLLCIFYCLIFLSRIFFYLYFIVIYFEKWFVILWRHESMTARDPWQ